MCRVRNTHTSAPWTTAYICLTLDDSCTDTTGKYVEKPLTVRMVQWQPYCVRAPFDPKTPVCAACKKTNRTRSFCRERHKHRQLPWCTVYVLLSALEAADPATVVAAPSKPVEATVKGEDSSESSPKEDESKEASSPANSGAEGKSGESNDGEAVKPAPAKKWDGVGDDINDIAESRTFLAKVCCKSTSIHWLDLAEVDGNDGNPMGAMHQPPDPAMYGMGPGGSGMGVPPEAHYYHPNLFASQHHQHTMKLHQQYNFHMQRHPNQYPAPWPPHYNQNPHMMHGQPMSPPPIPGGAPPGEGSPSAPPVSAGEAAAQQQKRNREMPDDRGQSPMHGPPGHPHGPPGVPHGQQQQWMLYQQMYPAQLPPMGHPVQYHPPPPGGRHMPPQEAAPGAAMMPGNEQPYNGPQSPNGKDPHESDSKRQRLV